mmetsp:Transcript_22600/g.41627  ORF Transcript_22600/g.41627 Transcript_22600/m.41627 type:complete len:332 (+) Transcript_22600:82-1077(+)
MHSQAEDDWLKGKRQRQLFFTSAGAHASALLLSKLASAPFERAKICLQVSQYTCAEGRSPMHLKKFVHEVHLHQGWKALWRGTGAHISAITVGALARLSLLRTSQMWMMPGRDKPYSKMEAYTHRCGFLLAAGSVAVTISYPFDLAYTNLAADMSKRRRFKHMFVFFNHVRKQHGLLHIYRGLPLCLVSAFPFVAIATAVHDLAGPALLQDTPRPLKVEEVQDLHRNLDGFVYKPVMHHYPYNLILGAVAGLTAQSVTYPLDTWRRRWQYTCSEAAATAPRSVMETFRVLWVQGGWRAFYAGYWTNVAKLVPELSVLCGVYFAINASERID